MTALNTVKDYACQVCEKPQLQLIDEFERLPRVTSDCRSFGAGGKLAVCMCCAAVQKIVDATWLAEINDIYKDYQAYRIADGEEQLVMDPTTGAPTRRSAVIMNQLQQSFNFDEFANVVDIGCGDGVTLKAMSDTFPGWSLHGHELGSDKLKKLERISGFKKLFTGDLDNLEGPFDLISMVHSLEHFTDPLNTLKKLRKKSGPDATLFVEVCNIDENPFDLLVADHLMHFSPHSLTNIAAQAGFKCQVAETNWVKKEISFVGSAFDQNMPLIDTNVEKVFAKIKAHVLWLTTLLDAAKSAAVAQPSFGIFGTSIAASWLATEMGERVKFFVDEDPNRVGREYMNKPVYAPAHVPPASAVYLALAPTLASKIADRLQNNLWSLVGAPAL